MAKRTLRGLAGALSALVLFALAAAYAHGGPVPVLRLVENTRVGPYALIPAEESSAASALRTVNDCFSEYPQGFFELLNREDGLALILVGGMERVLPDCPAEAAAFTCTEGGRTLIILDCSGQISRWTIMHEVCHAIDRRLARLGEEGVIDWSEEEWLALCPEGFSYHNAYVDAEGREIGVFGSAEYTAEGEGEPWFINRYSRTFPTEDRAVLFETLMRAGSGAEYLKSPHVIAKLSRYFEAIRMGFGGKWKSGSAFWEKRLEALLAGG